MLLHHRLGQALVGAAVAAAFVLAAAAPLSAQTTSASVTGTVKDAQGGMLPGVSVVLVNQAQGTEQTVTSDENGAFLFPIVQPGNYVLKLTLAGFQTLERTGVVVNANDRLTAGVFTLTLGQLSETVTVAGTSSDIQLRSGERAFTLQSVAMQNIAVNGRSFFGLAALVPGVVMNSDTPTQVSNLNANGQRSNSNNMTIDGVANIDTGDNGGNMAQTNLDAIAEFRVLTSSYQAEFGRAVGAQVQVVTKSGGRNYSGSAYWYARRSDWNANTWINNRAGTAMAKSSRNDTGFTIGGPVIPKKNLFFFFSQEFQRREDPVGETRVTVPTDLERAGNFSQSVDSNGNPFPYIRDYTTGLPCSASNTAGCFQDGGVLGKIPANRLFAPTLAALSIFPKANTSGQVGYNYKSQTPSSAPLNQTMIRMDYQMGNNWRFTGRYMFHSNKSELPYGIGGWSVRSNIDTLNVISDVPGRNWMASTTGILNNTTSLEISVGSGHNSLSHTVSNDQFTRTGAGMSNLPMLYTGSIQEDLLPQLSFGGGRIGNPVFLNSGQAPFTNFNTTYDIVANLTKVMGSHAAKAGFYYQRSQKPQSAFTNFNGSYNFDNSTNNPYDSQNGFANAALGIFNTFNQASSYLKPDWVYKNFEWYLQDNWRVSDRLTLDYGVRFYYLTPQWDTTLQASNFLPDEFNKSAAVRMFQPSVVDGVRVGYDAITGPGGELGVHRPHCAQHGKPVPGDVPGRPGHRRDAHRRQQVQGVASRRVRLRHLRDADARGARRLRRLLRPAAGQPGVRPDHQPAGPAVVHAAVGAGKGCRLCERLQRARVAPPQRLRLEDAGRLPVEPRRAVEDAGGVRPRRVVCRVGVAGSPPVAADQRAAVRHDVPAVEPGPDPRPDLHGLLRPQHDARRQRPADRPAAVDLSGLCECPDVGVLGLLELQGPADHHQPPLLQGADVQRQLHAQFGEGHRRRRLGRRPHRRQGPGSQLRPPRSGSPAQLRAELRVPDA